MLCGLPPTQQLSRAQAVARFGLGEPGAERLVPLAFDVWPENWTAVRAFEALGTQWLKDAFTGAAIGLRYEAVPMVLQMLAIPRREWPDAFEALRVMERAALRVKTVRTSAVREE